MSSKKIDSLNYFQISDYQISGQIMNRFNHNKTAKLTSSQTTVYCIEKQHLIVRLLNLNLYSSSLDQPEYTVYYDQGDQKFSLSFSLLCYH